VVTRTETRVGSDGSSVVPARVNCLAAALAISPETAAVATEAAVRTAEGGGAPLVSARCTSTAVSARTGGGIRISPR